MHNGLFSWEKFSKVPVAGIIRNVSMDDFAQILPLYMEAGLTTLEITMNTPDVAAMIRYAIENYGSELNIGAGTICNEEELSRALDAGAGFIVTPIVDEAMIKSCVQQEIPIFPGALTATEVYRAWRCGADMIKIFPATSVGPQYIKDLKGPLHQVRLMAVGGVSVDNCVEFLKAGAEGLGMGGSLFDKNIIAKKEWAALSMRFRQLAEKIESWQRSRK